MKNTIRAFFLAALMMAASACAPNFKKESDYPFANPNTGQAAKIAFVGEQVIPVNFSGKEYTATFLCNLPWIAESCVPWITITSTDRGNGIDMVNPITVKISKNASLRVREGKICVKVTENEVAYLTFSQEACPPELLGEKWYVKQGATGTGKSWADPIDLGACLSQCANADKIYVAAGTYTPTQYAGGAAPVNMTFLVNQNVSIYGGYPADAQEGAVANPEVNVTKLTASNVNHILTLAVPYDPDFTTTIDGLVIADGVNPSEDAMGGKINGVAFYNGYGGGIFVAGTKGKVSRCKVLNCQSPKFVAGVFVSIGSDIEFEDCEVSNNVTGGQGFGGSAFHNAGTLTLRRCRIVGNINNRGWGSALYNWDSSTAHVKCYAYVYDCYIANNVAIYEANNRAGAIYARENSTTAIVNTTFTGNQAGGSSLFFYGTSTAKTYGYVISSTVAENYASNTETSSGICEYNAEVKVYNSVVSKNQNGVDGLASLDGWASISGNKTTGAFHTVAGDILWGEDSEDGTFDPSAIGDLSNEVYPISQGSVAYTDGMSADELRMISVDMPKPLDSEVLAKDQKGNDRTGKVMGAYVGE